MRAATPSGTASRPPSKRRWRFLVQSLIAACIVAVLAGAIFRDRVWDVAAQVLSRSDQPRKSDLIYLLGGDYLTRAPFAAALFREGWAPKILLAREADGKRDQENFTDQTTRILLEAGVPRERIIQFLPATGVRSTADEARALSLYLKIYPASKVLVVTSAFHCRRARMAIGRAIPSGTSVIVVPANDPKCPTGGGARSEYCRNQLAIEWKKFVFYFFTFSG